MAGRSSTTFQKRQKELARQDRQKEKAAKRLERKTGPERTGPRNLDDDIDYSLAYRPDEDLGLLGESGLSDDSGLSEEKQPH
ncbi:MAG: hypothetical protein JWO80_1697 [Bryobacterales bacterium]|nr:hypothetical protein [Bryobacterales bacterium]